MDTILQSHPGSNNHCKSAFLIWNVNVCYFKLIKFIAIAAPSAAGVVPSNYRISSLWPLSSHNKNNIETRNLHVIAHYTKMRFKFSTDSLIQNKTHFLNLVSDKKVCVERKHVNTNFKAAHHDLQRQCFISNSNIFW